MFWVAVSGKPVSKGAILLDFIKYKWLNIYIYIYTFAFLIGILGKPLPKGRLFGFVVILKMWSKTHGTPKSPTYIFVDSKNTTLIWFWYPYVNWSVGNYTMFGWGVIKLICCDNLDIRCTWLSRYKSIYYIPPHTHTHPSQPSGSSALARRKSRYRKPWPWHWGSHK